MTAGSAVMLDAALDYASRDVPVFPVWHADGDHCGCRALDCASPAKHPIASCAPHGFRDATADEATIREWWTRFPLANIARPTGHGVVVIDVDPRHGGDVALAELERQHGAVPVTPRVLTGGGGVHLCFEVPPGVTVPCSVGKIGRGLDVRGHGGCVLLPPSSHVSGGVYRDDVDAPRFETPAAPMPVWLLALASTTAVTENGDGAPRTPDAWGEKLMGAPEGQRRAIALEIAGHYLGLRIAPAEVESILLGYAARCTPPFPEREARALVRDLERRDRVRMRHVETTSSALDPGSATATSNGHRSPWDAAQSIVEFLATDDGDDVQYLDPLRSLVPGALTEWFSPRGLGKTHVLHTLLVALAREGKRVLLLDRDNPKREIKRRLRAWGAAGLDAAHFRVMTRDETPPLTDRGAWEQFPFDGYDVVALDSLDASTEGVGEQDSAKPARAIAALLDLAHRASGPAVIVLGNTTKNGQAGRGSGVVEDRADIVYEIRDATDFQPTGTKAWWEELPPAARIDWASRATRRKRRDSYRLAFVATKHRVGPEPDPRVVEISLTEQPWTWRDVTAELVTAGEQAREEATRERQRRLDHAAAALTADLARRHASGLEMPGKKVAETVLVAAGITQKSARKLLVDRAGTAWSFVPKDAKTTLVALVSQGHVTESAIVAGTHEQRGFGASNAVDRMNTAQPHFSSESPPKPG